MIWIFISELSPLWIHLLKLGHRNRKFKEETCHDRPVKKTLTSLLPPSLDPPSSNISTESQFYWLTIKFSEVLCWLNITSDRSGVRFITIWGICMANWEAGQMLIFALRGRSIIVHIDNFLPCRKPLRIFYHTTSRQSVAFPFTGLILCDTLDWKLASHFQTRLINWVLPNIQVEWKTPWKQTFYFQKQPVKHI